MKNYEPYKDSTCSPCAENEKDTKPKLPSHYLKVPKGMANVTMGEVVTITIKGKVKGFSAREWDNCDEIELELHSADVTQPDDGSEFAELAEDD